MKKLLFVSNMPAPYVVKSANEMQKYFDTQYWFYSDIYGDRPEWWKIPLPQNCFILEGIKCKAREKFIDLDIKQKLENFNPDIIILGGFSIPTNMYIYLWAKKRKKKVIVFSEFLRDSQGKARDSFFVQLMFKFYSKVDGIFAVGDHGVDYFMKFFDSNIIHNIDYPNDIDEHLNHKIRDISKEIKILFAHRLIDIYNPVGAIEIFKEFNKLHSNSLMYMNASGDLIEECKKIINDYKMNDSIKFLNDIDSWNSLHKVYEMCDISISPAFFSNGNNSITEAMASGMGIVISDKIHFNDILLKKSKGGFIVKNTKEKFLKAIQKYIENPNLFIEHANSNRKVVKEFSIKEMTKKYVDIINTRVLD